MGQTEVLWGRLLKTTKCVETLLLQQILAYVREGCPWFPGSRVMNLASWKKNLKKKESRGQYMAKRPKHVDIFAFHWTVFLLHLPENKQHMVEGCVVEKPRVGWGPACLASCVCWSRHWVRWPCPEAWTVSLSGQSWSLEAQKQWRPACHSRFGELRATKWSIATEWNGLDGGGTQPKTGKILVALNVSCFLFCFWRPQCKNIHCLLFWWAW